MSETIRAYHFLRDDMTAGSGAETAWTVGETRTLEGKIVLCERGYHAAPSWWDALGYAPGPVACVVELSEIADRDDTKMVGRTRKLLAAVNVERQLREFACDCATEALDLVEKSGQAVDPRSRAAIEVARRFARGEAAKPELVAAGAAAGAAAIERFRSRLVSVLDEIVRVTEVVP